MTQDFFDSLQHKLIVPSILNLQSVLNVTFQSPFFANLSIFTMAGNGTSVSGRGLYVSNDTQMFKLYDDYVTVNITDLIIDLDIGYEFISDPPIIADLGFINLTLEQFDLIFNMTTYYEDYNLTLNVTDVKVDIDNFDFAFDGVNDFVYIIGGFVNKIVSIIAYRVKFIVEEKIEQIIPLINKILSIIPSHIDIPGTALHLDLGFANNITCKN